MKFARRLAGLVGLVWLCAAGVASASEPSKLLYSRGLVAFHAEKFDEAIKLFDKAVEADPSDSYARYYRGVTRARLGNPEGAVTDLRQVLQEKPDLEQASLDLGIALVETQHFEEALAPLDRTLREAKENDTLAQAALFKGIAHLRLRQVPEAREALAQALARNPDLPAAHYYAGVVAYQDGKLDAATSHFEQVLASRPTSAIGKESATFIERIRHDRSNNYEVFGAVGFQYDSNVVLAANNGGDAQVAFDTLGISHQDDGRATINLGGYYLLGRSDWARLTVGYEFYQSLHFQLHQFDLQQHEPMGQLDLLFKPFHVGATVRYDYYLLELDDFLRQFQLEPYAGVNFGSVGELTVFARILRRDFLKPPDSNAAPGKEGPDYRIRDGWNYAPGITQRFNLFGDPQKALTIGYQYDQDEPENPARYAVEQPRKFAYVGHQVSAGIAWSLPFEVDASAEYAYRTEHYAKPSAIITSGDNEYFGSRRNDSEHHIIVVASRPLTEHLRLNLGYFGLLNQSNKDQFDYDRQIASIALEARF